MAFPLFRGRFAQAGMVIIAFTSLLAAQSEERLSPRNANYTIEVKLDPVLKMLTGKEILEWRNDTPAPAQDVRFHLYWNAWKNNRSTFLREAAVWGPDWWGQDTSKIKDGDWSYSWVQSMKVLAAGVFGAADITSSARYVAPDDGNKDDQTVLAATLPRPVNPGETVQIEIVWKAKIPRTFARTGFRGDSFFLAQWFPKVGVFQPDGTWNCHQFHAGTEFFSDYGIYDVKMTVPRGWLLGATGLQQEIVDNPDGTSTHHYRQADVHDFAWTTSPAYLEATRVFENPGLKPVTMRLLYQPEHRGQEARHFRATEAALKYYGTWFGEYPYGHITVIDPAWGLGAGGMEYPTLFTCGTRYLNPEGGGDPEGVTVHEAGHQFWFALVGNNEFEHAWIDEGLNTFSTGRTYEAAFGDPFLVARYFRGYVPVMIRGITLPRMTSSNGLGLDAYRPAARSDVQATPSYRYFPATGFTLSYNKTALWLCMLERSLGWDSLRNILSAFFQRWKFRHPGPEDFFAIANEVSGRDLSGFFDQVFYQAAVFDFAVESVASDEITMQGYRDGKDGPALAQKDLSDEKRYWTRVVVRRLEDGSLPVDVLLKFENGEEVRDIWDGKDLWKLYQVEKPAKLAYAAVDPDRKILLDVNYTNNSRLLAPKPGFALSKWASKWMTWLQDYMLTLSFLI
jgi:hypothetical protein